MRNEDLSDAPPAASRTPHWTDRLVGRAVNEAAACLGDERYAGSAEIDLAVAAGGRLFRPHGGPLRFADRVGLPGVVRLLAALARECGRRFAPHPELARRAVARERFYGGPEPRRRRAAA